MKIPSLQIRHLAARWLAVGTMLVCTVNAALGEEPKESSAEKKEKEKEPKETKTVTEAEVSVGGQKIAYTATAGTLPLTKAYGEPRASVFYVAYVRKDGGDLGKRPITFCFNGGPGSSAVWLHLGAFGPRRVAIPNGGTSPPAPPYQLVPNEFSVLDASDLVFIDPVSTGFSRVEKGEDAKQFHGYREDLESVGDFIRRFVSKNGRWASPKFLAGESYGGLRAAGLAGHLQERYGMYLNGIAIVSGVVDFKTLASDAGNDLPYILYLPSMTAVAHFHKKLPGELQEDLVAATKESEAFAMGDYAAALLRGNALAKTDLDKTAARLARLTGLSADYWVRQRLRVDIGSFRNKLLEAENRVVGRFDARITVDATSNDDPSYSLVYGAYATLLNAYVRGDLKFESDLPYEILTRDVQPWSYASFTNRYVNASSPLADALTDNPNLRVFVACGHHDLATPPFAIRFTIDHLPFEPARSSAVSYGFYDGGHMMYTNLESLKKLSADMRAFIQK
ncbi:MAG: S10 family peptidase [Verrucomicrobiales bacterium]